ncbi:MSCRAMM family protein [Speluncibacter jeojiensis]|uniref:MSCRAMM family protein n=1 Tax=Speluncibacter jeojiensis TaxID=2710754 RepID=UPI002410A74F|nr:carboxypeptidase-like regulatory domain-containing protein [Rhodococcus sp. D2-41]
MTPEAGGRHGSSRVSVTGEVTAEEGVAAPQAVVTVAGADGSQVERILVEPDGSYAVRGLPAGQYTLIVSAAGYDPQAVGVMVDGSSPVRRDFSLAGGGVLTGTVRSRTGSAQARVVVTDPSGVVVAQAETDQAGSFRIGGLPQGQLVVTAAAAGHQPETQVVQVELGTPAVVEMVLSTVGGLAGVVTTRDGRFFAGATLTALDSSGAVVARAVTDQQGRYRIDGLSDGQYTVVTTAYQPSAVQVGILAGQENTADVVLESAGGPEREVGELSRVHHS